MKALILSQDYEPDSSAAAKHVSATARKLASCGFGVDVVTGFPTDGEVPNLRRPKIVASDHDGRARLTRVRKYYRAGNRSLDETLRDISVALGFAIAGLFRVRPGSVVYVSMPSTALAFPALAASYLSGAPLFIDVRKTLGPTGSGAGAPRKGRAFERALDWAARACFRRARAIFCATEAIREEIIARYGVGMETRVLPDGFDPVPATAAAAFARAEQQFVATYVGRMEPDSGVDTILDSAALLRDEHDIQFVLIGDGSRMNQLKARVNAERLENVRLLGALNRPETLAAFRDSNLALLPLEDGEDDRVLDLAFAALRTGCPLLFSGHGHAQHLVEQANAGWCARAGDAGAMADAIRSASGDREMCRQRGESGRDFVLTHYDRDRIALEVVRFLFAATSPNINDRVATGARDGSPSRAL